MSLVSVVPVPVSAQETTINPAIINQTWTAKWITCPNVTGNEYGVYLFRKTFELDSEARQFIIHVSADNRYKLYVNGKYVGNGPARGDLLKWYFESYDIAPFLQKGKNTIAAVVWNFATNRPSAQISSNTGFILQGNSLVESNVNTNSSWLVIKDSAYAPIPVNINQYYVTGPGERLTSAFHPWQWRDSGFNDSNWLRAQELDNGKPVKSITNYGEVARYVLYPREIPAMEQLPQRFAAIRRADLPGIKPAVLKGEELLVIPTRQTIKILLDQSYLTAAYPVLRFSKGKDAEIKLTYAESLFTDKLEKGNRNEVENKKIIGNQDIVIADGGTNRIFEPLWWRAFRYVELEIITREEPLIINDLYSIATGYPFEEKATFNCSDTTFKSIWNVGWHTQRLCAGETYFDCPYYEQLQYTGDTRIQALISSYVSGDTRLMRSAIAAFHDSQLSFGLTQSRYPSWQNQVIPPFSLVWITMVSDYWMIAGDKQFVKSMIPGIMAVLNWYGSKIDATGMLGLMEWWNFVDWVRYKNWDYGIPPGVSESHSAIINLQYVYTLQKAAALLDAFDMKDQALHYTQMAESVKSTVYATCFDEATGLMADVPEKTNFSQHANLFAVLTDALPQEKVEEVMRKTIDNKDIAPCSFYFRFYLTEALDKAGLADQYTRTLEPWKQMLKLGLSTFAEEPEPTRSDCHAWSASPVYYFLSLVCGIKPAEPGFSSVRIEPHPGNLTWMEGSMPHRSGTIRVSMKKSASGSWEGSVQLPENLTGTFIWKGKQLILKGGENKIQVE